MASSSGWIPRPASRDPASPHHFVRSYIRDLDLSTARTIPIGGKTLRLAEEARAGAEAAAAAAGGASLAFSRVRRGLRPRALTP
jgi:hypothetical protein